MHRAQTDGILARESECVAIESIVFSKRGSYHCGNGEKDEETGLYLPWVTVVAPTDFKVRKGRAYVQWRVATISEMRAFEIILIPWEILEGSDTEAEQGMAR